MITWITKTLKSNIKSSKHHNKYMPKANMVKKSKGIKTLIQEFRVKTNKIIKTN